MRHDSESEPLFDCDLAASLRVFVEVCEVAQGSQKGKGTSYGSAGSSAFPEARGARHTPNRTTHTHPARVLWHDIMRWLAVGLATRGWHSAGAFDLAECHGLDSDATSSVDVHSRHSRLRGTIP